MWERFQPRWRAWCRLPGQRHQGHRPTDHGSNGVQPPHGAGQRQSHPCLARQQPHVIFKISLGGGTPAGQGSGRVVASKEEAGQRNRWTRLPAQQCCCNIKKLCAGFLD
ncbi:hypothetical protein BDA96_10G156800 [Sorghum bicolor]|nr:hypothetical protein BDA96_10G156800 [Sorghum bicolor]